MISRTTRYALNILGCLVRAEGVRTRGRDIARSTGIPANYLSKILNQLRKQGIVEAEKGWGGGFRLRAEAADRPIRDVLAIFDGEDNTDPTDCAFGLAECDPDDPCPLHDYWERLRDLRGEMLGRTSIRDLGRTAGENAGLETT